MSVRRSILALATLLVLAAIGYGFYWFHAQGLVRKSIEVWAEQRRAAGWRVAWGEMSVGGFPPRIEVRLDAPQVALPNGAEWRADSLAAAASPFDLGHLHVAAPGHHAATLGTWRAEAEFGALDADVTLDAAGRPIELSAVAGSLRSAAGNAERVSLSVTPGQPDIAFAFAAIGVDLGEAALPVLDRRIARLEAAGRVRGVWPSGPALAALVAWSAAGGTIEIERLALEWEPLALEGDGTIAFDAALQPLAAFAARVRGTGPLMDRLAAARILDPGAAFAAKTLLAVMSKPDSLGRPAVPVPVTLQDGLLWLGPARLAKVPPIRWPSVE